MMLVLTNSLKAKTENGTVWKSGTARKFSPNPGTIRPKAEPKVEEKAEPTRNVFALGAKQRRTRMQDSRIMHPKEKVLEVARKKSKKHRKTCHWRPLIWGLLKCCQTTGDTAEDVVDDDFCRSSHMDQVTVATCSLVQEDKDFSKHTEMHCWRFSKHCHGNDCRDGEESSFCDCWVISLIFFSKRIF